MVTVATYLKPVSSFVRLPGAVCGPQILLHCYMSEIKPVSENNGLER